MTTAHDSVDTAIREADTLRKNLKKGKSVQVNSQSERDIAKATALAWFNNHLPVVTVVVGSDACDDITGCYHQVIAFTDRATTRTKYDSVLKEIKKSLTGLRKHVVNGTAAPPPTATVDTPPDFSPLIGDPKMQRILTARWVECVNCISSSAPLAATVMMGGLLETLMLARFNRETDKTPLFAAGTAPKDKTGKTLQLKEWTLRHYLDVGHELGWISRSTKDVGEVVRDFRNYIHPYKQASHGVEIVADDAQLFWEICKEISRQLLMKAAT